MTNETEQPEHLTEAQQNAIQLLIAGNTQTEVATAAGVDRTTLWRWQQQPHFIAALNLARLEAYQVNTDRLRTMTTNAVDVVSMGLQGDKLTAGQKWAAAAVLKAAGLDSGLAPFGDTDPDAIRIKQLQDEDSKKQAEFFTGLF